MRVFMTGATGFIGQNLLSALTEHSVYCYRRGEPTSRLSAFCPDIIIHAAGETRRGELMFDANVCLTHALLEEARQVDYKSFVYLGSSSEYGRCRTPMRESQALRPTTLYEATKGSGSLLCLAEAAQGRPVAVIRPFSVYGRYQARDRLIPTLYRCWKEQREFALAPGAHDWIYIDDLVRGILLVAFAAPDALRGQVINLGTGVQNTNDEVVRTFAQIAGPVAIRRVSAMHAYDSDCWVADISHARQAFGFVPLFTLKQGLEAYVAEQA